MPLIPPAPNLKYRFDVIGSVGMGTRYSDDDLVDVYDKNDGYCWHCGKKLAFSNYGNVGAKGAWEVDHSNPFGMDDLRNWVPACIPCNRSKQDLTTRQFSR